MAVEIVQRKIFPEQGSSSVNVALDVDTTPGNSILVAISLYSSDGGSNEIDMATVDPVTDTAGNTYTNLSAAEVKRTATSYYQHLYYFLATDIIGGSSQTVHCNFQRTTFNFVTVYELTPCQFDQGVNNTGTQNPATGSPTSIHAGTLTPSRDGSLSFQQANYVGAPAFTVPSGWAIDRNDTAGGATTLNAQIPQAVAASLSFDSTGPGDAVGGGSGSNDWSASGVTLVPPVRPYATAVLADSPVAYWPLNEPSGTTAYDSAGSQDATYDGGFTLGQAALTNDEMAKSVLFNGSSANATDKTATLPTAGPFTVECMAHFASASGSEQGRLICYGGAGSHGWGLGQFGSGLQFTTFGIQDYQTSNSAGFISATGAYHIVAVFTAGHAVQFYVNGVLEQTITGSSDPTTPSFLWASIGADNVNGSNWFSGDISDVAVYGSALSGAQVLAHYNAAIGAGGATPVAVAPTAAAASAATASVTAAARAGSLVGAAASQATCAVTAGAFNPMVGAAASRAICTVTAAAKLTPVAVAQSSATSTVTVPGQILLGTLVAAAASSATIRAAGRRGSSTLTVGRTANAEIDVQGR